MPACAKIQVRTANRTKIKNEKKKEYVDVDDKTEEEKLKIDAIKCGCQHCIRLFFNDAQAQALAQAQYIHIYIDFTISVVVFRFSSTNNGICLPTRCC